MPAVILLNRELYGISSPMFHASRANICLGIDRDREAFFEQ